MQLPACEEERLVVGPVPACLQEHGGLLFGRWPHGGRQTGG
jgi:hypothetical protein